MNPYSIIEVRKSSPDLISILVNGPDGKFWIHSGIDAFMKAIENKVDEREITIKEATR